MANEQKRGSGRPRTGNNPSLAVRIPRDLYARVVDYQRTNFIARLADAVAELLEMGLARGPQ